MKKILAQQRFPWRARLFPEGEFLTMRRLFCLLVCLSLWGCQPEPPPELRLDDLSFGNKRVGRQAEPPVFHPGEDFYLGYKQRGATPDKNSYAKVSLEARLSHGEEPFHEFHGVVYKLNSDLTAYGPPEAVKSRIPPDAFGAGELVIQVTDHVAEEVLTVKVPYLVEE